MFYPCVLSWIMMFSSVLAKAVYDVFDRQEWDDKDSADDFSVTSVPAEKKMDNTIQKPLSARDPQ